MSYRFRTMKALFGILWMLIGSWTFAAEPLPIQVTLFVPSTGWMFYAWPDGSIRGIFGSSTGDSIHLPAATIDFEKLVEFVRASTSTIGVGKGQASLLYAGEVTATAAKPLSDDTFIREFFLKNQNRWKGWTGQNPSERVQNLMLQIHYYRPQEPTE